MKEINENLLFRLVAASNEKAFSTLFDLFLPRLYPFILKLTKSESAVQEIIQETFIKVWLNRDKLAEMENPGGWIYRVAANKCYDHLRERTRSDRFSQPLVAESGSLNTTYEWLDSKELQQLIGEAVNHLPAQRKKIYQMSRDQGKSIPEIALKLQLSPNTVKNALVISLRSIREYLEKHGATLFILNLFIFH